MKKRKNQDLSNDPIQKKSLRLWPGIIIVILQWLIWYILPRVIPGDTTLMLGILGGFLGGLVIMVWWAFFSRAPRFERWGAIVLMIVALVITSLILDESLEASQMGLTFFIYAIPLLSLTFVIWAVASRRLSERTRRVTMVATILLTCGVWTLLRTDGMTSDMGHDFSWRWDETPEGRFLAQNRDAMSEFASTSIVTKTSADWPGFRGPSRDGIIRGVQIETDWSASPPIELWHKPIGPGFSSFAVQGDLLYTQEQRGEYEVVSCYKVTTGKTVWIHQDTARFLGADANPGPRATPTLANGRVYTFGATGILNVLDANNGNIVWSCNAASDADVKVPVWGFASSPLVVDNVVIVQVAGMLIAYNLTTGDPSWFGPVGNGYSSPQLLTIDGVEQIVLLSGIGATSFSISDGEILWEYTWEKQDRILQPALTSVGDILLSTILKDIRRLIVDLKNDEWIIKEDWTSTQMKSNFNDMVVHEDLAFGFDNQNLACINLKNGKRMWKGRRYGGQLILLADQDILLVLSEKGELALVEANSEQFNELARFPAINGKTWNHPVLVNDILLVRNSQEMAAFRLSASGN